ncbi:hypothetical protein AM587_10004791 [Phytophthora nicotianae]|uniref:Uncharacterized protein n=1 Tax=Phytophthora nicotianae TaxID=4792 RepID=A0A0W8CB76_PHYNI|nr:hypothetical protein AM587_10004791 [Phytophthora nicotianae]
MVASCYYFAAMASLATLSQLHTTTATSVLLSIKLGFYVHRSTMAMYSFTSFDIYVKPVVTGNDVIFDGKATFEQDGVTHNFYLVDGVPFHEVVTGSSDLTACLPVDNIPSVSDIFEAVASATPVSNVNTDQEISCNNGTWLSTTYAGEPYVLCTTEADANGGNFIVYGEDLSVSFEFLSDEVNITKPVHSPSNCQAAPHDSVELSSLDLLYGITSKNSHRALTAEARTAHLASSTCACVCGTTSNGLLSKEYAGLLVGGLIIPHHSSNNDGIVELQSCVGDLDPSKFDTTYASTWYAAKLNHADTTFHNGDALFSSAQKPLKWFECLL